MCVGVQCYFSQYAHQQTIYEYRQTSRKSKVARSAVALRISTLGI
jgi:hypothetical protein